MRRKITSIAVAGAIGVAGVTGVSVATAAPTTEDGIVDRHVERIREALTGLVQEGTIDQEQADAVAEALAEARPSAPGRGGEKHGLRGGPGGLSLDVAAELLDLSQDELRAALVGGSTLAELAAERGVAVDTLVDALVQAAQQRLNTAVAEGRLSQGRADALAEDLVEHVRRHVEEGTAARSRHA